MIALLYVTGTMAKRAGEAGVEVDIRHRGRRDRPFGELEDSDDRAAPGRHNSPSLSGHEGAFAAFFSAIGLTPKFSTREGGKSTNAAEKRITK